uniref:Calcium-independent phospholipase A2-gamma n=1 Tax=Aceria tosichella TaxID=561515 RepID=A0A6G1SLS6_9ACAR
MLTRSAIKSKAHALIKALDSSKGTRQKIILKDINDIINDHPQSVALIRSKIDELVGLSKDADESLASKVRQTLSLIGHAEPPPAPGVRVLSLDGGGTRGLVSLEILRHIERATKKRIHELFDLICGVSSGAIITMAIGSGRFTLDQCETFYREMSENIFKTDIWSSTPRLLWSHAYYDATIFEKTLKNAFGNLSLMHLASEAGRPKLVAVSVNAHTVQPFLFRTYAHNPVIGNVFDGTCKADLWQAIRASSAAPGYFQEFKFNSSILLDGGMLVNNCAGVAHTEANLLWPKESIQCLVSVGSGKFKPRDVMNVNATSLYEKAHGLVYSATDTETIHMILRNLIDNYYRLNPQLSENILISENRKLKLDQLKSEARQYMHDNEFMLSQLAKKLTQPRQLYKRVLDIYWPSYIKESLFKN